MEREIDLGHSIAKSELGWEATLSNIGTAVRSTPMGLTRYIWWNILLFFFLFNSIIKVAGEEGAPETRTDHWW